MSNKRRILIKCKKIKLKRERERVNILEFNLCFYNNFTIEKLPMMLADRVLEVMFKEEQLLLVLVLM